MSSPKVSVYSVSDLKNTTDDVLPTYLSSLRFQQKHTTTDVKLTLGYVAVAIAGALFYYDWKFGWDYSKPYTLPAVAIYFILNGAFTYWIYFVEGSRIFAGQRGDTHIQISTKSDKYRPIYKVTARWTKAKDAFATGAEWKEMTIRAPFTRWFTADGYFVAKPFQQWLASNIPAIGEADPKNVVEEIGRGNATEGKKGPQVIHTSASGLSDVLGAIQGQAKQRR